MAPAGERRGARTAAAYVRAEDIRFLCIIPQLSVRRGRRSERHRRGFAPAHAGSVVSSLGAPQHQDQVVVQADCPWCRSACGMPA